MGNMSYVRFQNTQSDLEDCLDHIDDEALSEEEEIARVGLIATCREIVSSATARRLKKGD